MMCIPSLFLTMLETKTCGFLFLESGLSEALMWCLQPTCRSCKYTVLGLALYIPLSRFLSVHIHILQNTSSSLSPTSSTIPHHITTLPPPLHPIHLPRIRNLRPRLLSPHRQPHRMSPSPITAHIPQPFNIRPDLPPQIILNRQSTQLIHQTIQLRQWQLS